MRVSTFRLSKSHRGTFLAAHVDDYGAVGDGVHDDAPAIRRAFRAAANEPMMDGVWFRTDATYLTRSAIRVTGHFARAVRALKS